MSQHSRIQIVDILRGWALLGVVICNYTFFAYSPQFTLHGDVTVNKILQVMEGYLLSGKGWTLLHVLFGFGFGVFLERSRQKGQGYFPFVKRMLWLLVFALVNTLFYEGDILRDYAVLGLVLVPFYALPSKKLIIISAVLLLLTPFVGAFVAMIPPPAEAFTTDYLMTLYHSYHPLDVMKYNLIATYYQEMISPPYLYTAHYVMFLCMLVGLILQKRHVFGNLELHRKTILRVFVVSLVAAVLMQVTLSYSIPRHLVFLKYFQMYYWCVLATMVFTTTGICLLHLNGKCQRLFGSFAVMGRMTLTNYMMQNVISFFIFKGVGLRLFDSLPYYVYFIIAIGVYVLQLVFSSWWLKGHAYGPMEGLWRKLSRTKKNREVELVVNS